MATIKCNVNTVCGGARISDANVAHWKYISENERMIFEELLPNAVARKKKAYCCDECRAEILERIHNTPKFILEMIKDNVELQQEHTERIAVALEDFKY